MELDAHTVRALSIQHPGYALIGDDESMRLQRLLSPRIIASSML